MSDIQHRDGRWHGSGRRSTTLRSPFVVAIGAALGLGATCARSPEDQVCPDLAVGDLVVTEIRGPQSSPNSLPQWIELANLSGDPIDLEGLHIELLRPDGSGALDLIVRYKRTVAAADYYVLGLVADDTPGVGVDYGLADEYSGNLYEDALLSIVACGEVIDAVIYENLPKAGTYSLGLVPPDAEGNDVEAAWCVDATPVEGPMTALGIPGTPGEANRPCG